MISRSPIARKLTVLIVVFSTAITILTTGIQLFFDYKKELDDVHTQLDTVRTMQVSPLSHAMWTFDAQGIQIIIDNILKIQGIEFLEVSIDEQYTWSGGKRVSKSTIDTVTPITFESGGEDIEIGTLKLVAGIDRIYDQLIDKTLVIFAGNGFKTFFVSLFILFLFQRLVTRHLIDLAEFATQVASGNSQNAFSLGRKFTKKKKDELDETAHAINLMRNNLEQELQTLTKTQEELKQSEERFRHLSASTFEGIVSHDKGVIVHANEQYYQMFGYTPEELAGIDALSATTTAEAKTTISQKIAKGDLGPYEVTGLKKDGTEFPIEIRAKEPRPDGQNIRTAAIRDLSQKKQLEKRMARLEKRIQHSEKLEAIGTLAGGIAHDFNNILSVIIGYAEMAKEDVSPQSTAAKDLDEVLTAGNRARDLVRQILAFSRQDEMKMTPISLREGVEESVKMLRSSLPSTIEINLELPDTANLILADPTQIHQIVMNLCTNAYHAMEESGGTLDISLKEVTLNSEDLHFEPDVVPGMFSQLTISDSGPGIPSQLKQKIFDPYFTTKDTGKGTGMGLAIVHGIVKRCNGFISVKSEPDQGCTFHIYLPVINRDRFEEVSELEPIPVGKERILFIDDEEMLAEMGKLMLERLGYHVTVKNDSTEALQTFQEQPEMFDLVITDQTMPGMTGVELARKMLQIRPEIPIILCTGYSAIISEQTVKSIGIKEFALKPLTKRDTAVLIRKVLTRP